MKKILIISDAHSIYFFRDELIKLGCHVSISSSQDGLNMFLLGDFETLLFIMEKDKKINSKIHEIREIVKASLNNQQSIITLGWLKSDDPDYLRLPIAPIEIVKKIQK